MDVAGRTQAGLKSYLVILVLFFVIDFIWVGVLARPLWNAQVQRITGNPLVSNRWAGLLSYLLLALGLNYLAFAQINPALHAQDAFKYGALFGLVIYGVFDLTNMAIFNEYSAALAFLDIFWGMLASAITLYLAGAVLF